MAELKPCPFCGGEADAFHIKSETDDTEGWVVGCTNDKCVVRPSVQTGIREAAVFEWNRRADNG